MRRPPQLLGLAVALIVALSSAPALADARAKARRHFAEAMRLLGEKQFDAAISEFERANEAIPHPDVVYNLARACESAGRFEEAIHWLDVYLTQSPRDVEQVKSERARLAAKITPPSTVSDPAPRASLDDAKLTEPELVRRAADEVRPTSPRAADQLEALADKLAKADAERTSQTSPKTAPEKKGLPEEKRPKPKPSPVLVGPSDSLRARPVESPPRSEAAPLREIEDYEEREVVAAASRRASSPKDAPAAVWVITALEIRRRGYESVAEALEHVAGLHLIDDHVFVDLGVRGVHAGLRGQSRIIRVLIDGQPVAFRPTSGNFLGPEMIPIRAVERIELIRGPASALYGANAFLGVLAIVTKRGGDLRGASLSTRVGFETASESPPDGAQAGPSASGDFVVGTQSGRTSFLLAGSQGRLDRSGLRAPESSALFERLILDRGGFSQNDVSRPRSLFGSLSYDLREAGQLTLTAGLQELDSRAEWLDFGALTHDARVHLRSTWARLAYDGSITPRFGLSAFLSIQDGQTGPNYQFRPLRIGASTPDSATHLVPAIDSSAVLAGAEARLDATDRLSLRIGADFDLDREASEETSVVFDQVVGNRRPGDIVPASPSTGSRIQKLENVGAYSQISARPTPAVDLIGGVRFDYHNVYKASINGRVGSVFRLGDNFYAKALYGSSFRVPAPDQLVHEEAYTGDIIGCENYAPCSSIGLEPQRAHTGEIILGIALPDSISAQLTGFVTYVSDLILSFPNTGEFIVTGNAGAYSSSGFELEASGLLVRSNALTIKGHGSLALASTSADIPESQFDPPEAIRAEFRDVSLYPPITASGGVSVEVPMAHVAVYGEGRYVGPRRASGSNLALAAAKYEDEQLPGYFELDLNLSSRDLFLFGDRETELSLRVNDVFHSPHAEGGHRGWDVPALGRMVFFRVLQEI
ncbi:MAG: TonB-dependent receptor [Deltaproteobacteria bacterium]|nr:TonB-dependent receptor [Deltaproteobacteria bacterium]